MAAQEQAPDGGVSEETRTFEEQEDARASAKADRPPTPEEEAAAPTSVSSSVAENYQEAIERGANVKGEGQIEP